MPDGDTNTDSNTDLDALADDDEHANPRTDRRGDAGADGDTRAVLAH